MQKTKNAKTLMGAIQAYKCNNLIRRYIVQKERADNPIVTVVQVYFACFLAFFYSMKIPKEKRRRIKMKVNETTFRKDKGITLIALVVTIIVLLILWDKMEF